MSYSDHTNRWSRPRSGVPNALLTAIMIAGSSLALPPVFAGPSLESKATTSAKPAAVQHDAQPDDARGTPLSVAPLALPAYPDDRPEWIDQPPVLSGSVHLWPVASVPSLTEALSVESLAAQKRIAVAAYIQHVTGSGAAGECFGFDAAWVDAHLLADDRIYSGTVITSNGTMYEHAAQMRFDDDFRQVIRLAWNDRQVARRLSGLGLLGAVSLGALVLTSGLLKAVHRRTAGGKASVG